MLEQPDNFELSSYRGIFPNTYSIARLGSLFLFLHLLDFALGTEIEIVDCGEEEASTDIRDFVHDKETQRKRKKRVLLGAEYPVDQRTTSVSSVHCLVSLALTCARLGKKI